MRAWKAHRSYRESLQCSHQLLRNARSRNVAAKKLSNLGLVSSFRPSPTTATPNLCRTFISRAILREAKTPEHHSKALFEPNDPASWARLVEPHLPPHLRQPSPSSRANNDVAPPGDGPPLEGYAQDLNAIIARARKASEGKIDLLVHIALHEGRWEAVSWIMESLIHRIQAPSASWTHLRSVSTMAIPSSVTLNEITSASFTFENDYTHSFSQGLSLDDISSPEAWTHSKFSESNHRQRVGEVLQSLGRLTIQAARCNEDESRLIMIKVVGFLARFRQYDLIPEAILNLCPSDGSNSIQRSGTFEFWVGRMFKCLDSLSVIKKASDQSGENSTIDLTTVNAAATPEMYPAICFRPDLWFEFILWCCLQWQSVVQASSLIKEYSSALQTDWSLFSWRSRNQDPNDQKALLASSSAPGQVSNEISEVEAYSSSDELEISVEVIIAIIDGLVTVMFDLTEQDTREVLHQIKVLKNILDLKHSSLDHSFWDRVICRIAEDPLLVTAERNPRLMEETLEKLENAKYPQIPSSIRLQQFNSDSSDRGAAYVFDDSAATLGLHRRTLLTYIQLNDRAGALRLMQTLFDRENEVKQVQPPQEKWSGMAQPTTLIKSYVATSTAPVALSTLRLPVDAYAKLLDFAIDIKDWQLGFSMVRPDKLYGGFISRGLYRHDKMYPSLIRFAESTKHEGLLRKLGRAKDGTAATAALVALCGYRIRNGDLESATRVLVAMRNNIIDRLSIHDVTNLVTAILPQIYAKRINRYQGNHTSVQAAELLKVLLGGFDLVDESWNPQLQTIIQVLASLEPQLGRLSSSAVPHEDDCLAALPCSSFDALMQATVAIWGSAKGRALYEMWCRDKAYRFRQRPSYPDLSRQFSTSQRLLRLGRKKVRPKNVIDPELSTIQIIIRAAVEELHRSGTISLNDSWGTQQTRRRTRLSPQSTLQWAAQLLEQQFLLSQASIDYEMQGISLQQAPDLTAKNPYGKVTLRAWQALQGNRRDWVLLTESRLRAFASSKSQVIMLSESLPPTERSFLHSLARDFLMVTESTESQGYQLQQVKIWKSRKLPQLPSQTISEIMSDLYEDTEWDQSEEGPAFDYVPLETDIAQDAQVLEGGSQALEVPKALEDTEAFEDPLNSEYAQELEDAEALEGAETSRGLLDSEYSEALEAAEALGDVEIFADRQPASEDTNRR